MLTILNLISSSFLMSRFRLLSLSETPSILCRTDISKTSNFLWCFLASMFQSYNRMGCSRVWYSLVFTLLLVSFAYRFVYLVQTSDYSAARPTFCRCPCHLTHRLRLFLLDTQSRLCDTVDFHEDAHRAAECLDVLYTGLLFWHCLFLAHVWKWLRRLCWWGIADYIRTYYY